MRGSIVWRCEKCGNKTTGTCKHPGGSYSVVIKVGRQQKWKKVGRSKKEAERYLSEVLSQVHTDSYRELKKVFFRDFSERWLVDYAAGSVKPLTLRSYRGLIRLRLNPAFGDRLLSTIMPADIQSFVSRLVRKGKISPRTINYNLTVLKMILKHAKLWGLIRNNPAENIRQVRQEYREMDYLRPDEIQRLLKYADEPFKTLFLLAVMTGMRLGEILGLQWGCVDWHNNVIRVRRSLYWRNKKEFDALPGNTKNMWTFSTPKSKRSIRNIVMSPRLKEDLEIHRINCSESAHDFVFSTKKGMPLHSNLMVAREFKPALSRAGLRKIRFHDLRHTYTTLLIAQGTNIKFIQTQLGHASIKTTLDRYGHLLPEVQNGVGAQLDAQLFKLTPGFAQTALLG